MNYKHQTAWRRRNPWARYVEYARRRCNAPKDSKWWPHYGAKGIAVALTAKEAKVLWDHADASKMMRPSLDRIKTHLGYTLLNCRFVEWLTNVRAPHDASAARDLDLNAEEAVSFV